MNAFSRHYMSDRGKTIDVALEDLLQLMTDKNVISKVLKRIENAQTKEAECKHRETIINESEVQRVMR